MVDGKKQEQSGWISFKNMPAKEVTSTVTVREICVTRVTGPECYNPCCDDSMFEAVEFTGNPTEEEKSRLRWQVTTEHGAVVLNIMPTVIVVPAGAPTGELKADVSLSLKGLLPRKLTAGEKINVCAYFKSAQKDGADAITTIERGKDDICALIGLIQDVEGTKKGWSGEKILNGLRRLTLADTYFFQWMYGFRTRALQTIIEDKFQSSINEKLNKWFGSSVDLGPDIDYALPDNETTKKIYRFATHHFECDEKNNLSEIGVVEDCSGLRVALGHAFTGMSAGPHRVKSVTFHILTLLGLKDIDNLYALTIAGDLGQSAIKMYYYSATGDANHEIDRYLGGEDQLTEATNAELIGDIDGFILGTKYESFEEEKISAVLARYYSNPVDKSVGVLQAHHRSRFTTFKSLMEKMDWEYLVDQVESFMVAFGLYKPNDPNVRCAAASGPKKTYLRADEIFEETPPFSWPFDYMPALPPVLTEDWKNWLENHKRIEATRKKIRLHAQGAVESFKTWLDRRVAEE